MPAGVEVINDFGSILIDAVNPCMVYVGKYTHANFVGGGIGSKITLTDSTPETMLAYVGGQTITMSYVNYLGGTTREYWFANLSPLNAFEIYRFEKVKNIGSTSGLVLWNGAGAVTFDSAQKPGRVVGAYSSSVSITVPSGRKWAAVFSQTRRKSFFEKWDPEDGGGWIQRSDYYQSRGAFVGSTFNYNPLLMHASNQVRVGRFDPLPTAEDVGSPLVILLDVTNY